MTLLISKDHLIEIRNQFSVKHTYGLIESPESLSKAEIGPIDGAIATLIDIVHEVVLVEPVKAVNWLIAVIFTKQSLPHFITCKDAHVHVLVALETLIFIEVPQ